MKKSIKFFLLIVTSIVFTLGLSSCSDDGYSLNDIYASLVTVNKDSQGRVESFTLDNGKKMWIAANATNFKPQNERAVINYTILGDKYSEEYYYAIKLNGYIEDVLTKSPLYVAADDKEKQDEMGYDRIKVAAVWAGGGYINIRFGINIGGKDQHSLNLVALQDSYVQVGDEPIKLQFRHNKNKDVENYGAPEQHVSFRLDKYVAENPDVKELKFEISWTEYSGEEKTQIVKYTIPTTITPPEESVAS